MKTKFRLSIIPLALGLKKMSVFSLLFVSLFFLSQCKKDSDKTVSTTIADGFYYKGSATAFTDINETDGNIPAGYVDAGLDKPSAIRTGLWATFVYLTAGNLTLVKVASNTQTNYGIAADGMKERIYGDDGSITGAYVANKRDENFKNCTQSRGVLTENGTAISVTKEGLYFLAVDEDSKQVILMPITRVGITGSASPSGWGKLDNALVLDGTLTKSAGLWKYVASGVDQANWFNPNAPYKVRFNNGWNDSLTNSGGSTIYVQCNLGKDPNAMVIGGVNMTSIAANGKPFGGTFSLTWSGGTSFSAAFSNPKDATVTTFDPAKTGNFYSLIGDALTDWNTDNDFTYVSSPSAGTYIYSKDFTFTKAGGFKIRQDHNWGVAVGATSSLLTLSGPNKSDIVGTDNFEFASTVTTFPVTYTFKLTVTRAYNEVPATAYVLEVTKQ